MHLLHPMQLTSSKPDPQPECVHDVTTTAVIHNWQTNAKEGCLPDFNKIGTLLPNCVFMEIDQPYTELNMNGVIPQLKMTLRERLQPTTFVLSIGDPGHTILGSLHENTMHIIDPGRGLQVHSKHEKYANSNLTDSKKEQIKDVLRNQLGIGSTMLCLARTIKARVQSDNFKTAAHTAASMRRSGGQSEHHFFRTSASL